MQDLASRYPQVQYYSPGCFWGSKDLQVNKATEICNTLAKQCFLWEVDVDEHWTHDNLVKAELFALDSPQRGFCFQFNQFVGLNKIAAGDWGSGTLNRLWKWCGESFRTHEPALLMGQRSCQFIEGIKFDHYSYYFDKDVKFKSMYYKGHEDVYMFWKNLWMVKEYPAHISVMFGNRSKIGKSKSQIYEISTN